MSKVHFLCAALGYSVWCDCALLLKINAHNLISLQKGKRSVLLKFLRGVSFVLLAQMKEVQEEDLLSYCPPYFTSFTMLGSA